MAITIENKFYAFSRAGFTGRTRTEPVTDIVIHGTAAWEASNAERFILYMEGRPITHYRNGASTFHYLIGRDGKIYRMLDDAKYCHHCGVASYDRKSIGIELYNGERNLSAYTEAQYDALAGLIAENLIPTYPTITTISGHWRVYIQANPNFVSYNLSKPISERKPECPGPLFNWTTLQQKIESYGYTIINNPGEYQRVLTITGNPPGEISVSPNPNNKYLATINCTFKATSKGAWTPAVSNLIPTFNPSNKIIINGNAIATRQITWTITGCILSGDISLGGSSSTPISATTSKCVIENNGILRKGDKGVCNGSFQNAGPCSCDIEIDNPGQEKVLGS